MTTDRERAATGIDPEAVAVEMKAATARLREQGWKIAPLTNAVTVDEVEREQRSA